MKSKHLGISLAVFIALSIIVQLFGSFWTEQSVNTWYPTLSKPSWTPPDWVFGPVWTVLYIMIAISGWLIYRAKISPERTLALIFWGIQLVLNFSWSFFFFSLRSPILGLIDILALCVFVGITIVKAWPVRPLASLLLVPYMLWVLYAATVNAGVWFLNR